MNVSYSSISLTSSVSRSIYQSASFTGKGDPPNPSASVKDIQREKDLDTLIRGPPPLPFWVVMKGGRVALTLMYVFVSIYLGCGTFRSLMSSRLF